MSRLTLWGKIIGGVTGFMTGGPLGAVVGAALGYAALVGAVLLHGAGAWLECSVEQVFPAGDHGIVLMRLRALTLHEGVEPLVFAQSAFRRLASDSA